ncbi:hypothetical protein AB5I41_15220 [Sphingomonas sp. MMS24-JH45]
MRRGVTMLALAMLPATGGCVAKAAWDVATLPVRAGAAVVDGVTTSPKERDEKWVRQQRKADEREAKSGASGTRSAARIGSLRAV